MVPGFRATPRFVPVGKSMKAAVGNSSASTSA